MAYQPFPYTRPQYIPHSLLQPRYFNGYHGGSYQYGYSSDSSDYSNYSMPPSIPHWGFGKSHLSAHAPTFVPSSPFSGSVVPAAGVKIKLEPQSPMDVARQFASTRSHADLLRFALGMHIDGAPEIAQNAVVNVLDCESFEHDHSLLTEVGLVSFERREMVEAFKDPGPHGENILKRMYFYHLRLISNAHFVNRQWCPGDPEKNHFGNTRFLTHSEVKSALNEAFAWPLDPNDPSKGNCPVFFMGHAVSNDLRMLQDSVGFDAAALGTVVATLDTQQIARDVGIRGRGHQIGLQTLAGFFGVQYRDPHTACNDAAYTIIAAVQMVLNNIPPSDKSLQSVVEDLEVSSQAELTTWGISKYCTCCGQAGHLRFRCALKDRLFCNRCAAAGRENAAHSHIDEMCSRIH